MPILKLPLTHALDWYSRIGVDMGASIVGQTARTITLDLSDSALADLRDDAEYYASCMGPDATGDLDWRPRARTLLRALNRLTGS